jgi:alkylhydroperoxidase family enzyme
MKGIRLEPGLHLMVVTLASQMNGCGFCVNLARAMAMREHLGMEKFNALLEYRTSTLFSDRERAALAYVDEATRHKRVADATFEVLRKHFNEWEIAAITWLNALENYYNLINLPLEIESDGFCAIAEARTASCGNGERAERSVYPPPRLRCPSVCGVAHPLRCPVRCR